jgi:hypothetical protein
VRRYRFGELEFSWDEPKAAQNARRHVVRKAYDSSGRFLSEAYFDGSFAPVSNKEGVHKIAYEYDAWGERLAKRYFGPDGSPVLSSHHKFHELRHRRDALRNPIEWGYYDVRGERVICPTDDAAFGRFKLNEYGSEVRLDYFGISGERRMSAYGFATRLCKLDTTDAAIEWSHFDSAGKPVARNFGHSVLVTTRDERGNATRDVFLDVTRRPVRNREGYAETRMTYDERDNCTSTAYFGEQSQPMPVIAG